ncbi:MAG TPA: hypothetical protein VE999_09185 [Gemmataceae bacterium]|nr:hypothetical protein [Gemmataceae bacterium]
MVRPLPTGDKPRKTSDPVDGILTRIRALLPDALIRLLDELARCPRQQLGGRIIVHEYMLEELMGAIHGHMEHTAREHPARKQMERTHQRKRKPSKLTLERLEKIERWRVQKTPVSWNAIDNRLGMYHGGARQLWRDAHKRGWI